VLLFLLALAPAAFPACIDYTKANDHVGESVCVSGKVVKVVEGHNGAWYLDFCDDYTKCPFVVVVFAKNLRDVGDVRRLQGQTVEVFGKVKLYRGKPEIILSDARQLHGEAAKLPPMPKDYDASRHGRYSSGSYRTRGKPEDLDPERRDPQR
jgi:DNA/RNA endonuclease YhcR with UshA esterase domain